MSKKKTVNRDRCLLCRTEIWWVDRETGWCGPCLIAEENKRWLSALETLLSHLWEQHLCAYCGDTATDREHVVPRCSALPSFLVPSCSECNSIAGGTLFSSPADKAAYIKKRLRSRFAKDLSTPRWSQEEIEEMGPGLRPQLLLVEERRAWVEKRISWSLFSLFADIV